MASPNAGLMGHYQTSGAPAVNGPTRRNRGATKTQHDERTVPDGVLGRTMGAGVHVTARTRTEGAIRQTSSRSGVGRCQWDRLPERGGGGATR